MQIPAPHLGSPLRNFLVQNLRPIESRVRIIVFFQEVFRFPVGGDFSSFNTENFIGSGNRIHPMGDEKNDFPCAFFEKMLHNERFVFGIQLVCPLVENDNGTILEKNADNGEDLVLSAGEFDIFSDFRIESKRGFSNLFIQSKIFQKFIELRIGNFSIYSKKKIDPNGRVPISTICVRYLRNNRNQMRKTVDGPISDILPVKKDISFVGSKESGNKIDKRGFSRSIFPNDSVDFSRNKRKIELGENFQRRLVFIFDTFFEFLDIFFCLLNSSRIISGRLHDLKTFFNEIKKRLFDIFRIRIREGYSLEGYF